MGVQSIAIISDTHLPMGSRRIPEVCIERLRRADLIIHAGDLMRIEVLEQVRGYGETVAVHGNADDAAVRAVLPDRAEVTVAGARIAVVHNGGPAKGRLERMARRYPGVDVVIFGHSHIPLHERDPGTGFQIFNPGSATDRRRQPYHTMGWAEVRDGTVALEVVTLD